MTDKPIPRKPIGERFPTAPLRARLAKVSWKALPGRIVYRLFRLSGELTAIILGLAIIWFFALNSLLARQTVNVSGLKPNAQLWFSQAFNGSDAQIGDMRLSWLPASNNIVFDATNVAITDKNGNKIETIPRLQTEIPLSSAYKGVLIPERLVIEGGSVTWMRNNNGDVIAGLGTPETVGRLGPVWRGQSQGSKATAPDVSVVKSVTVTGATAFVVDDSDGLELTFTETDINFQNTVEAINIFATSRLEQGADNIPLTFKMLASPNVKSYAVDFEAEDLNPSRLSPRRGRYAGLKSLNTSLDVRASVKVDENKGLETADIDLKAGGGSVDISGRMTPFDAGHFKARLTTESQLMDILDFSVTSGKLKFKGKGSLGSLGALTDGNINSSPVFDLSLADVKIDLTPQFESPLQLASLKATGRLDIDSRRLDLDVLQAGFDDFELQTQGAFQQTPEGDWDSIVLSGSSTGALSPDDLLSLWPVKFVDGARRWIERSIVQGQIRDIAFKADLSQEVLAGDIPANDDIDLTFNVSGGDVRYISTMTPYTGASGKGRVTGNSASFDSKGGQVGAVSIETGKVNIPVLRPYGGNLIIDLKSTGKTSDMLGLIDQKPFEFASKYGINPEDFAGMGEIDMTITRPLREHFDRNLINYTVQGKFEDVSAPFSVGPHKLKNGFVTLTADKNGMTVKGPVNIGPWQAELNWQETFDFGATPTRYKVQGSMTRDTLDGFGLGFREYFDGEIGVSVDAIGAGLDLSSATVNADLSQTTMRVGDYWAKEKGSAGKFTGLLKRQPTGSLAVEDFTMTAPGFDVAGRVELARNFRLLDLDLKRANIEGFIDAAVKAKPDELNEKLSVFITGQYLDVSPFVANALRSNGGGVDVPILLTAGLEKLALNEAYVVQDANVLFAHNGEGITNARLAGRTNDGEIKIEMLAGESNENRTVRVDIPDASEAAFAFLKLDNITGGRLEIDAELPPLGTEGSLMGVAQVEDFKLIEAPILAQMLSIASLQGLFNTLGGEGLKFNNFIVPFALTDGSLQIREARVSGPALGMTGNGEIRFMDRALDLDGALVPAYTANSMLGDIPVIGDIFVGKKGEGIFALSYTVKGPFDKTQVAVNPLSALTPGFLRGIFRTKRDKLPDDVKDQLEAVKPQ